jgi:hypothetical protein
MKEQAVFKRLKIVLNGGSEVVPHPSVINSRYDS